MNYTRITRLLPIKLKWPNWLLRIAVKKRFKMFMGYPLNLRNPKTFNEKIQWYKLYYSHPDICKITDKFQFKEYVKTKLDNDNYTAKLFGAWMSTEEFINDWGKLPNTFVLKSNLSYNGNNLKFILNKGQVDVNSIIPELKTWLDVRNTMMNTCSCRFNNATPRIIAEEYICQEGHTPNDYKFFCFGGEPKYVYVATEHFNSGSSCISFYDMDWNLEDVKYADYLSVKVDKPEQFDEMCKIAKKLSFGFPFVRVDFFNVDGRVYLSELTFDSGDGHRKFQPSSFDEKLGSYFNIQISK